MAHNSAQGIIWKLAGESRDLLNGGNNYKRRCSAFLGLGASLPGSHRGRRWRLCVPKLSVSRVGGGKSKVEKNSKGCWELENFAGQVSIVPCSLWKAAPQSRWVSLAGHPALQGGVSMAWSLPFPLLRAGSAAEPHGNTPDVPLIQNHRATRSVGIVFMDQSPPSGWNSCRW